MTHKESGILYLVGTPIGNLGDITLRALETLKSVDLIAAEDTRQTQKLLNHFNITKPVTSYFEHNKRTKGPQLLQELEEGKNIALVSDAGMPGISDPGADLIQKCIEKGLPLSVIPGPSAVLTGLVASGLDTRGFVFAGFIPREKKERKSLLADLAWEKRTLIFYESPHRLVQSLEDMSLAWGERRCCVARELTKLYEEFKRGTLRETAEYFKGKTVKGEITLVVEGKAEEASPNLAWEEILAHYEGVVARKGNKKEAVKETAKALGISRRELYQKVMVEEEEK